MKRNWARTVRRRGWLLLGVPLLVIGALFICLDYFFDEYLKEPRVAKIVQDAMLFFDKEKYLLSSWVVMPNHVHLVTTPLPGKRLAGIMQSLKSFTANEANNLLDRKGTFWMPDYFDRYVRSQRHLVAAIAYVENNPVKAGLCRRPEDWPFSSAWFRAREEW